MEVRIHKSFKGNVAATKNIEKILSTKEIPEIEKLSLEWFREGFLDGIVELEKSMGRDVKKFTTALEKKYRVSINEGLIEIDQSVTDTETLELLKEKVKRHLLSSGKEAAISLQETDIEHLENLEINDDHKDNKINLLKKSPQVSLAESLYLKASLRLGEAYGYDMMRLKNFIETQQIEDTSIKKYIHTILESGRQTLEKLFSPDKKPLAEKCPALKYWVADKNLMLEKGQIKRVKTVRSNGGKGSRYETPIEYTNRVLQEAGITERPFLHQIRAVNESLANAISIYKSRYSVSPEEDIPVLDKGSTEKFLEINGI